MRRLEAGQEPARREPALSEEQKTALANEIVEYLQWFPAEYVRLFRETLKLDLKYYRSARIKAKG